MMSSEPIVRTFPLGFPWETVDPFLFCVHHDDHYPAGTEKLAPAASLAGRDIGQDFSRKDGWSMYHGRSVPGFPQHPHRGFETLTLARRGLIDHSDSLGAVARFGKGDAQWMTAGSGVVHAEMFPLLNRNEPNPVELFQIWINLPAADKMAKPHFTMLWDRTIPKKVFKDPDGRNTHVAVVAGTLDGAKAPSPPPRSYASRPDADVAVFTIRMDARARWTLPAARGPETRRVLYYFAGTGVHVAGRRMDKHVGIELAGHADIDIFAGDTECEFLLLQGRPIAEPVVQYGPFVMNTRAAIQQAYMDYQRTQFGGWPWPSDDPNHGPTQGRFARHVDGRVEKAEG